METAGHLRGTTLHAENYLYLSSRAQCGPGHVWGTAGKPGELGVPGGDDGEREAILWALKPGPDPGDRSGRPAGKTPSIRWTSPGGGRAGQVARPPAIPRAPGREGGLAGQVSWAIARM